MNTLSCADQVLQLSEAGEMLKAVALCESVEGTEDTYCQRFLGWYWAEQGNFNKSLDFYTKAATKGSIEAQEECLDRIQCDPNSNQQQKIELCESLPYANFLCCQKYLTYKYYDLNNQDNLLYWGTKVAEHGNPDDLFYVATLLDNMGQTPSALEYYKRASVTGNIRANHFLGDIYAYGLRGIPKDIPMGISYYEKSAAHGIIIAQKHLLQLKYRGFILFMHSTYLVFKTLLIALRNINDPRLIDIPDCEARKKQKKLFL